jgi:peptidoglycan/LPS O-acetylase OafA/YrhL
MQTKFLANSANLDCLRALAVIFVVADHMLKFLGHPVVHGFEANALGRLGVMFFFVHTCTVLMLSLERQQSTYPGSRLWINFYIRRAFRIYPLSMFAVAVVVLFQIPSQRIVGFHSIASFIPRKAEILGNLALTQNVLPRHSRDIIGVLWSLPFEVQMYLFLPALFLWLASKGRLKELLLLWVLSWGVAAIFLPLQYVPHFLPGVIAYVVALKYRGGRWPAFLFLLFLATLTVVYFAIGGTDVTGRVMCLALGLLLPLFANVRVRAFNLVTHNIAKYSYGVYLSHLFCLWFAFTKFQAYQGVIFGALLVIVPVLLFHLIESPMIRVGVKVGESLAASTTREPAPVAAVAAP